MTAKDLRSLLYDVPDNSEIVILNENAPIKGAVAKNAGTEEVAGTAIAKAAETAVAEVKPNGAAYITTLLNNTFEEFQKARALRFRRSCRVIR